MRKVILLSFLGFLMSFSKKDPVVDYIKKYKNAAIEEMNRTGIPASIKLAQALVESENGTSELATNANNHFGIKCGKSWEGEQYYKIDDDRDTSGNMIESCFRVFSHAEESFVAHSNFLRDPKKDKRYGFLFELPIDDYTAWASGLKEAGYATDPNYPNKLINIIEKYDLHLLDHKTDLSVLPSKPNNNIDSPIASQNTNAPVEDNEYNKNRPSRLKTAEEQSKPKVTMLKRGRINGVAMVKLPINMTCEEVAKIVLMKPSEIIAVNEYISTPSQLLNKGEIVVLDAKHKDFNGSENFHVVLEGETMELIANQYGMEAKTLYILNRIPKHGVPLKGEKLLLKQKVSKHHTPAYKLIKQKKEEYLF